jgi:ABC-type histidine transport system ATPase subunit
MQKLIINNLYKSFGDHVVLDDVSLTASPGDVIALLGSSGSGKSTLLRCVSLLDKADSGVIQINGYVVDYANLGKKKLPKSIVSKLHKKIGMVFQQFNLWPHMTVLQNLIEAPLLVLKQSKDQAIENAKVLLKKVGILHKETCYPLQLSGGEQQRVAIARALMMKPEIMLFDEPTSALDPEVVMEVLNVMKTLANEGTTMIVATHEIGFAKEVASQVIFLEQGKIHEQGGAKETLNNPKTTRLKQFLQAVCH